MTNNTSKQGFLQKRLLDVLCDVELHELDNEEILKVVSLWTRICGRGVKLSETDNQKVVTLSRNFDRFAVSLEEITAELLESIDTPDDLKQLAESSYIGANRKFPYRRRI